MTDIVDHLRAVLAICTDPFTRADLTAAITEIKTLRGDLDIVSRWLPESHWEALKEDHPEVAKRLSGFDDD